jgi:hypothetical protein
MDVGSKDGEETNVPNVAGQDSPHRKERGRSGCISRGPLMPGINMDGGEPWSDLSHRRLRDEESS